MFKEYFSHDYNTRSDWKIQRLIANHGMKGYGVFWAVVEDLYINQNKLPYDLKTLGFYYRIEDDILDDILKNFGLFIIQDGIISCNSIDKRLFTRTEKSEKARISAQKRWNKSQSNANEMQTHTNGIAIKENNIKEKNIKEKENTYKTWNIDDFKIEIKKIYSKNQYPMNNEDYVEFLNYWSETTPNGKFRFQLEKTWDTEKRIARWSKNIKNQPIPTQKNTVLNALNKTYRNIIENEY